MASASAAAVGRPSKLRHRYAMASAWRPAPLLAYFALIIGGACFAPLLPLQLVGFAAGSCLLIQVEGPRGLHVVGAAAVMALLVAAIAPFFDVSGKAVLFTFFGRPYTVEALLRGALTGCLVANMLVWFACAGRICGAQGVLEACGKTAPRIGMVTSLVVQMVPRMGRRASQIAAARKGAGLAPAAAGVTTRAREAAAVLATVASSSLEGAIVTADAMESRGYGTGPRTSASASPLGWDEKLFCLAAGFFFLLFCALAALRAAGAIEPGWSLLAITAAYGQLAFIPFALNLLEDIRWRF